MSSPRPPRGARLGRRVVPVVALALLALCGGCQGGQQAPVSLQLVISTADGADAVARANLKGLANQVANDYMRIHPEVFVHLRLQSERELVDSARSRTRLGAGPDLLITRVAPAELLDREGLLLPAPISAKRLHPLRLKFLSSFREGDSYRALPFLLQPNLACYDRRRVPKAPATLDELKDAAGRGVRVGLPLQMSELLWIASAFDADRPLLTLFRTRVSANTAWQPLTGADRSRVEAWLAWLARANIEPTVKYVETGEALVPLLEAGQLDWIRCNSSAINRLKGKLGSHLGVSVLPGRRIGQPARSLLRLQLLTFGRDSSAAQRRAAANFALFVLNDFSQNDLMIKAFGNLPANGNVVLPVKDMPALAAMEASLTQSIVPTFSEGVGFRHVAGPLRQLLKKCVYGEESPQEVGRRIEAVAKAAFRQTRSERATGNGVIPADEP